MIMLIMIMIIDRFTFAMVNDRPSGLTDVFRNKGLGSNSKLFDGGS